MQKIVRYLLVFVAAMLLMLPLSGVKTSAATKLTKPTVTKKLNSTTGRYTLSWDKVKNADYYVVSVTNKTTNKVKTYEVTGRSYVLKNDPGYQLSCKVKACTDEGISSKYSTAVSVMNKCAKPTLKATNIKNTCIRISWAKVTGASGYKIYATDKTAGTSKKLLKSKCTELSFDHKDAINGHQYTYSVVAICKKTTSANSSAATKTITRDYQVPTLSVAKKASSTAIQVTWGDGGGASHKVQIYYKAGSNGSWTLWKTCTSKTAKTLTFSDVKDGTVYYFRARSTGSDSEANSPYCTAVSIMTSISKVTITADTYKGQPKISWKTITGGEQYEVYKLKDGSWKKMKSYSTSTSGATLSYTDTDKTLVDGKTYQYKVKAIGVSDVTSEKTISVMFRKIELNTTELTTRVAGYCGSPMLAVNGTEKTVTWSSSNTSVLTVKDGDLRGIKTGTATVTAKVDGLSLTCKVAVVSDSAYVEAFLETWIEAFIEEDADDQTKLLTVTTYMTMFFQKNTLYTKSADVIYYGAGSTKSVGNVAVLLLEKMGFEAEVRSMSGDNTSMYPSGVKVGASYYNIEATKGGNVYYIACQPEGDFIYLIANGKCLGYIQKKDGEWDLSES